MKTLPFDSWRWPQIVGLSFFVGFLPALNRGLANAILLGLASVLFWGPAIAAVLYFRRRAK